MTEPLLKDVEDYAGNPIVLDDTRVQACTQCGALILDELAHVKFHLEMEAEDDRRH